MNARIGRLFLAAGTAATLIAMPLASRAAEGPELVEAATLSTPSVIVSEIGWAGSSMSTVDEWLELTNLTDDAIDLSGWTVTGAASTNGSLAIPDGKSVQPHSTFLISNYDEANAKSSLARAPDLVTSAVSLSNPALALGLVDANGTVRDSAGSGGDPLAGRAGGGTESPGIGFATMVRRAPVADGTIANAWETATGSDGFDVGATDLGTPGVVESWFVPAQVVAPEPELVLVTAPIVETATPPELVSLPDGQEGSSSATASEENPGVVAENAAPTVIDTVPATTSEPATINAEPLVAEIPPDAEPDAVIAPPEPMTPDTATPAVDAITPTEPTPAIHDPVAVVEIVPDTVIEAVDPTIVDETPTVDTAALPADPTPTTVDSVETVANQAVVAPIAEMPETISTDIPVEFPEEPTVTTTPIQMVSISPIAFSFPSGTLLLNEFVSDAAAEWIEVLNPFNNVIDLSGWTVRDATGKATALPDQIIGLEQFAVVTNPSGKLNNDGDTIELVDPSGSVVDAVTYGTGGEAIPKTPSGLARNSDGVWTVTSVLTPGTENRFDAGESTTPQAAAVAAPNGTDESETTHASDVTAAASIIPVPAEEPTVTETPNPTTLRLTQIYPNATGDDSAEEFVAIENFGTETVDLKGWSVADASGKTFSPVDPTPIDPGATLVLYRETTKIVLNNTSDSVALSAPDGTLIDSISYDAPPIGSILRLQDSNWIWSGNVAGTKQSAVSSFAEASDDKSIAQMAPASASGGSVSHSKVSGTVLVAPGVLGKQIFYVDDGDGGIQVYKNDADFPDIKEGDVVTVTGTVTESRGEERLKVGKTDSITVVESTEPEAAETMAIADIAENDHGKLIRVAGIVLVRSGSHATLEDHGAQIAVRVADGTGIDATTFARGASVEVTGILVAAGGTLTLLPRAPDDVTVLSSLTTEAVSATVTPGKSAQAASDRTTATLITLGTLLSIALFAGRKLIPSWNQYAKTRALRVAAQAAH